VLVNVEDFDSVVHRLSLLLSRILVPAGWRRGWNEIVFSIFHGFSGTTRIPLKACSGSPPRRFVIAWYLENGVNDGHRAFLWPAGGNWHIADTRGDEEVGPHETTLLMESDG
jgi:hypothetical protein